MEFKVQSMTTANAIEAISDAGAFKILVTRVQLAILRFLLLLAVLFV